MCKLPFYDNWNVICITASNNDYQILYILLNNTTSPIYITQLVVLMYFKFFRDFTFILMGLMGEGYSVCLQGRKKGLEDITRAVTRKMFLDVC